MFKCLVSVREPVQNVQVQSELLTVLNLAGMSVTVAESSKNSLHVMYALNEVKIQQAKIHPA